MVKLVEKMFHGVLDCLKAKISAPADVTYEYERGTEEIYDMIEEV